jgi:hypothetical protein
MEALARFGVVHAQGAQEVYRSGPDLDRIWPTITLISRSLRSCQRTP